MPRRQDSQPTIVTQKPAPKKLPRIKKTEAINNLVVFSDTHCGCRLGLCPRDGIPLDDGGPYLPSTIQKQIYNMWEEFWGEYVPLFTRGEPFAVVCNGDAIDGVHHNSTTQVSHNLTDQGRIAEMLIKPVVEACEGRYYHVRGTEAHVGQSASEEERLAKELGAIPNQEGQYARWDLWKNVGDGLVHLLHHIGTTGSSAYESTAVHKELVESYVEAGRWREQPPDILCRSHRHRFFMTEFASANGDAMAVVTPAWQAKTPFTWKIPGARLSQPQFGGIVIRQGDEDLHIRKKVWRIERSPTE